MSDDAQIRRDSEITGLLQERAGYAARGLTGRVADVDAELASRGYTREQARKKPRRERAVTPPAETG